MRRFLPFLLWISCCTTTFSAHAQTASPTPDPNARISIGDAKIAEGNSGSRDLTFPVTLNKSLPFDVGIQYLTRDLSAIAPGDYTPQVPTPLILKAGQTRAKIIVRLTGDTLEEANETFRVLLARPWRVLIGDGEGIATILDDDHKGIISIGDAKTTEGHSGSRDLTFPVTLSKSLPFNVGIQYLTRDLSAIAPGDYTPHVPTPLTLKAGQTSAKIIVRVTGDIADEANETFRVLLARPSRVLIGDGEGIATILDDDPPPPPFLSGKIAFTSERDGDEEIYVMNANGTNQTQLTNNDFADYAPCFSPDGSKIAFVSYPFGNSEICVMNADGTNQTQLTNNGFDDQYPCFSPDGSKIAYGSHRGLSDGIYVMNADGTNQIRLSIDGFWDYYPRFSADGSKIAFTSYRDGNGAEIYVMNANGTNQTRLTNNDFDDVAPCFSPDGSKVAFTSRRSGNYEIYVMNANGTSQTRLTANATTDSDPSWAPGSVLLRPATPISPSAPAS